MRFMIDQLEQTRSFFEVNGTTVCVLTSVTVVSPAQITREDIRRLVSTAKQSDPNDPESWWEVEIPGLETVEWSEKDDLESEVANALNRWGVSIADWTPYRIEV